MRFEARDRRGPRPAAERWLEHVSDTLVAREKSVAVDGGSEHVVTVGVKNMEMALQDAERHKSGGQRFGRNVWWSTSFLSAWRPRASRLERGIGAARPRNSRHRSLEREQESLWRSLSHARQAQKTSERRASVEEERRNEKSRSIKMALIHRRRS